MKFIELWICRTIHIILNVYVATKLEGPFKLNAIHGIHVRRVLCDNYPHLSWTDRDSVLSFSRCSIATVLCSSPVTDVTLHQLSLSLVPCGNYNERITRIEIVSQIVVITRIEIISQIGVSDICL